jgi:hypothetical protein
MFGRFPKRVSVQSAALIGPSETKPSVLRIGDDGSLVLEGISGQTVGNARGAGAIDLQTLRSNATRVASGANSVALGAGMASGIKSIAIGNDRDYPAVASGVRATAIGSGQNGNTASGVGSLALGDASNAAGDASVAIGSGARAIGLLSCALTAGNTTNVHEIGFGGVSGVEAFVVGGNAQCVGTQTTDATDTPLTVRTTRIVVPTKTLFHGTGKVIAYSTAFKAKAWDINFTIARDDSNNTRLIGTPTVTEAHADAEAADWAIAVSADDTNEALVITVTGQTDTTIRWGARLDFVKLTQV